VIPHIVDSGLSILQYVDDTILFIEYDFEKSNKSEIIFYSFGATFKPENKFP
jgi:hypothetical protein